MNSLFAALVNGVILSTLLTMAVWLGLLLAPRRLWNAATRYGVWWATLAAALSLPLLCLPSATPRQHAPRTAGAGLALTAASSGLADPPLASLPPAAPALPRPPARLGVRLPLDLPAGGWPRWILGAWALLSVSMLLRLALSYTLLERHKRHAADPPAPLAPRVEQWLALCGCTRGPVRLAVSPAIATPMVAGLSAPAILFPRGLLEKLEAHEIDQIGVHEAAHLARSDDFALMAQRILEALMVLHPAVHWIGRQLDLEREIACDDFVLRASPTPRSYAACLVRVVELTGTVRGSVTAAAVVEGRSLLGRRVDLLLDGARHTGASISRSRMAAAAALVAMLAGAALRTPAVVAFARPAPVAAPPVQPLAQKPSPAPAVSQAPVPSPSAAPQPAPRPAAPPAAASVRLPVTVQDPLGRYVTGLTRENFRVWEDGVPQEITAFSTEQMPTAIGILFDVSGSMRSVLPEAQRAVSEFRQTAGPDSQSFLVTYNDTPVLAEGFTSDPRRIQSRLDGLEARGGTAMRDAVMLALEQMRTASQPVKALLIVSDGSLDNSSSASAAQVLDAVKASHVQVDAMSFPPPEETGRSRGLEYLSELASVSGGRHFVSRPGGPPPAAGVGLAFRNVYMIEYTSTNQSRDGKSRPIRVEVTPPAGSPPVSVHFRIWYSPAGGGH